MGTSSPHTCLETGEEGSHRCFSRGGTGELSSVPCLSFPPPCNQDTVSQFWGGDHARAHPHTALATLTPTGTSRPCAIQPPHFHPMAGGGWELRD